MNTPTTRAIEKDQSNFRDLLIGLRQFIDEQLTLKVKPHHALAIYNQKLEKYKQLFGAKEMQEADYKKIEEEWNQ